MLNINDHSIVYGSFGKLIKVGGFEFMLTGVSVFKNKNTISGRVYFESNAECLEDIPPILIIHRSKKFSGVIESANAAFFEKIPATLMINQWRVAVISSNTIVVKLPLMGIPTNL